jgi:hypothetical protein
MARPAEAARVLRDSPLRGERLSKKDSLVLQYDAFILRCERSEPRRMRGEPGCRSGA